MIIYTDIINNNEQVSKAFIVKEDDLFYVAKGSMIVPDVEDPNDETEKVIDIPYKQGLELVDLDKTTFSLALKNIMKTIAKKKIASGMPKEEVKAWQGKASVWANNFLKEYDDWQFYVHASVDDYTSCFFSLCKWEDGVPMFYFFKDALKETKV